MFRMSSPNYFSSNLTQHSTEENIPISILIVHFDMIDYSGSQVEAQTFSYISIVQHPFGALVSMNKHVYTKIENRCSVPWVKATK